MTMHVHHLAGCAPAPLAHYLKALGILRLVAEQADPQARGWWQDEHFCLMTTLDRDTLERFFLEEYKPTPFVSPWNKGAGFFTPNDAGLAPVETSQADRFAPFRGAISDVRKLIDDINAADATIRAIKARTKTTAKAFQSEEQRHRLEQSHVFRTYMGELNKRLEDSSLKAEDRQSISQHIETLKLLVSEADKPPTKQDAKRLKDADGYKPLLTRADKNFKALKASLVPACQRLWRGPHAEWFSAAVVLDADGNTIWPSMLRTGGNDGNLDYTNNAMQQLGELFDLSDPAGKPHPQTRSQLEHALWSTPCNAQEPCAIGQFLPGGAGGANSTNAPDGSPLVNPWDFILMLEGAILFGARVTRRLDPQSLSRASAPFVMHAHAAGFLSPGGEKDQRGEQWMPLWSRPSTLGDVSAMLSEGRLDVGRRVAHRPLDAARAVARLGVARGVDAFTRYGYLERNGQSNLAVSLGRIVVRPRPHARLIDNIAPWLDRLHRLARGKHAPARLIHAERRLADAVFGVLTHDETAERWHAVLRAMVAVEAIQARDTGIDAGPVPRLNPQWIKVADDGSAEMRLAAALGSAAGRYVRKDGRSYAVDPVRHHWLPLEKRTRWFQITHKHLARDSRVVMHGRDPVTDLIALVERRFIESTMDDQEQRRLPLVAAWDCNASLADLADLLAGHVDLVRTGELARAFMAVDWARLTKEDLPQKPSHQQHREPEEAWLVLRLAALPWRLDEHHDIRAEPAMIRRLSAGEGAGAVEIALRRLRAVGLRPPMQAAFADALTARLWAAALAFPISQATARQTANILDPSYSRRSS